MANLLSKTADGSLAFDKYITKNPRYKEADYDIESASPFFTQSGSSYKERFTLGKGEKVKILQNRVTLIGRMKAVKVKWGIKQGWVPLKNIETPTKLDHTKYEKEVVDTINNMIVDLGRPISIKIKNEVFDNISYAVKVDKRIKDAYGVQLDPKADIILCEDENQPFKGTPIFISHKKEGTAAAFQQYGGISQKAGLGIYNHPEVQFFLERIVDYMEGQRLSFPVVKYIQDPELIKMSIFGPEYGKKYSIQNVQMIGQGQPVFKQERPGIFALSFTSHTSYSGDVSLFRNNYVPVLGASYREGRSFTFKNQVFRGARVGIYPKIKIVTSTALELDSM
jgi:hypothetical protein